MRVIAANTEPIFFDTARHVHMSSHPALPVRLVSIQPPRLASVLYANCRDGDLAGGRERSWATHNTRYSVLVSTSLHGARAARRSWASLTASSHTHAGGANTSRNLLNI